MKQPWIACLGRKGGSGKTALALGLSAHYGRAGRRVLLVDLDPQGSATLTLGAAAAGDALTALLSGAAGANVAINERLDLLPGGPTLERADLPPGGLRVALGTACAAAATVVLDCPPGHAALDRLALGAADVVLACCEAHRMGIAGAARVLDEARALRPRLRCALVLSRVDDRRGLDRAAPDLLAGAFAVPVLTIHQDAALALALNAGGLPPASGRAAADVATVAAWIDKGQT
jgi:chromosome partitioning protein